MKRFVACLLLTFIGCTILPAQDTGIAFYTKKTYMIPMRDGVKLFTVVLTPAGSNTPLPFLVRRTPYGADINVVENAAIPSRELGGFASMAAAGYIFVLQDIRGKYKSEGHMEIHQPITHLKQPGTIDESTDTYDAIDWLVKNIPGNNGKAGLVGISYPGWLALVGAIDPHPALKASSEQACMADLFLGDDFHHNGAFRLSYGMEYSYELEHDKTTDSDFPFPQFDLFNWYLKLGPLKHVNERYFHNTIPTWNNFVQHPDYDSFWKKNSTLDYTRGPEVPMLHVGGYYDQEDINGPQLMYGFMEKKDSANKNFIVLGPWNHGQWMRGKGDSLGKISFDSNTSGWFQELQKQWFDHWLKGIGDGKFTEANCFQTGSNQWRSYKTWPVKEAVIKKLYARADGTCSFEKPTGSTASVQYTSDPAKPVPYRALPIEATYGEGSRWRPWQVEDQRFVTTRPDVVSFVADSLTTDLTVTGMIKAHVIASTTAGDADFIVKLIDVYPDKYDKNLLMSGYELPVAMEVFRGRFRKSFAKPQPFTPGKPEEIVIDLHQVNHRFLTGHKIMIQIQSSWFPLIDRNPQKYVPNIFEANASDFIKATHTIYCNGVNATYVELPVIGQ